MMRAFLPLLILLYFIIGVLLYAAATPMFESPDEASHFLYAHHLNQTGQLPILEDRDTVFASRAVQRHHPPLYYLIGAALLTGTTRTELPEYLRDNPFAHFGTIAANNANVLLHPLQPPPGDSMQAAWRLRLLSLLFACGTVWCVYRVGLMAFGRFIGLAAMFIVASMPTFVSISGSINNDNAVTFFYSAGIAWTVWVWQKRTIRPQDALILGTILAGAALSKITGLTLIGFVGLVILAGGFTGRFTGVKRQFPAAWITLRTGLIAGMCVLVLAGWWYLRNLQLYGDPLALTATNAIWGRMPPTDPEQIRSEAWGVWESFWLILGHFNVRGPDWFYPYVTLVSIIGGLGILVGWGRNRARHALPLHIILLAAVSIVVGALIFATRTVNVSQGRILFPSLAAFVPLLILGWATWTRGFGRFKYAFLLMFVPLILVHLMTPFTLLAPLFAPARPVAVLPADAIPFEAGDEWIKIVGYHITPETITPDDSIRVRLYLQGMHPSSPALFFKVIDPVSLVPIGGADIYPGMTPLAQFDPSLLYEIDITLPIDRTRLTGRTPRRLDLFTGLRHITSADPNHDDGIPIPLVTSDGATLDFLQMPAATLIDPDYMPSPPEVMTDVVYGNALRLVGYTVSPSVVHPGDTVSVRLVWQSVGPLPDDWTMALGLLDTEHNVIIQADGPLTGYPTSAWQTGIMTEVTRTLTIPSETAPGDVQMFIGWYRPTDANQRLEAQGSGVDNNLLISPPVLTLK